MRWLGPQSMVSTPQTSHSRSNCNTSEAHHPNQANQSRSLKKVSWRTAQVTLTHQVRNSHQCNLSTLRNLVPQWPRITPTTLLLSIRSLHPIKQWKNSKLCQRPKRPVHIKINNLNVVMEAPKSSPRTIMIRIRIRIYWQDWEARAMNLQSSVINKQPKAASLVLRRQIASAPTLIRIVIQSPPVRKSMAIVGSSLEVLSELEQVEKAAT